MRITVTIRRNTLIEGFTKQSRKLLLATDEGLAKEGRPGQRRIRYHTPRRTGEAQRSVKWELVGSGQRRGVRWYTDLDRFIFLEDGTRPHKIQGNPLLAFTIGGRKVVVRSVNHPGTPAYEPFRKGTETLRQGRVPLLRRSLTQAMQ